MRKRLLAIIAVAAMLVTMVPAMSFADDGIVLPSSMNGTWQDDADSTKQVYYNGNYYANLGAAIGAIPKQSTEAAEIYCKPGGNAGAWTHAEVYNDVTIYGNGASATTSGGECDITVEFSGQFTGDVDVTVKDLNGIAAWGTRKTSHTLNLTFDNCKNMTKIFIMNSNGPINMTLTDCSFMGYDDGDCFVYSNAAGNIEIKNCEFTDEDKAINLNHKSTGTQKVTLENCTFTNCGNDVAADQIPVRLVSSEDGGKTIFDIKNCTFSGTPEGGADILLDYGVGIHEGTVSGTTANVMLKKENNNGTWESVSADNSYEFEKYEIVNESPIPGETPVPEEPGDENTPSTPEAPEDTPTADKPETTPSTPDKPGNETTGGNFGDKANTDSDENLDKTPDSGDDFNVMFPMAAAGLALAAMATVMVSRKRNN